jgi:hypothetical protein
LATGISVQVPNKIAWFFYSDYDRRTWLNNPRGREIDGGESKTGKY